MKKIVILAAVIILITGCSVKYKLTINEDLSIIEEASLTGTDKFFENYYKSTKINVVNTLLDVYKDVLSENNYKYEVIEDKIPYVNVSRKYTNVNDYINNSKLFNGYFDEIKYTENGNIKRIETIGYNDNNSNDPERFDIKELKISIKCPYVVKNHNASDVNEETNTYFYELSKDNDYKIVLEFDASKKFNPNSEKIRLLIICFFILIGTWVAIIVNKQKNK